MKKLVLFFGSLLLGLSINAQGLENFDNFTGNGTAYYDGTFLGQDGSTWTFTKARGDAAAEITPGNQALMLRNKSGAELISGTLHNGIETLQFSYMQAFSTDASLEVYVNATLVYTAVSNNEQGVAKTTGIIDLSSYNVTGDFVLTFKNLGSSTGQVSIDDVEWTAPAAPTCDDPTNLAIQNITDQTAEATWTAGGTESEWVIIYGPTNFDPINDLGNPDVYADTTSANPYPINGLVESTDYDVYVIAKCGAADYSGMVGPVTFTTDVGASVENEVFNNFSYYPNPVHDQLLLKAEGQIESVIVYDLLGNDVITLHPNTMETQITTKGLQNGVYLVKVTLNGLQKTFRLVKK